MISCIVVDDESHAIEILTNYINKTPFLSLKFATFNPLEALGYIQDNPVDLIFLDIQMPDLTGIQFLQVVGDKYKFVLTTAYAEYALEGYEYAVIDYLLKPFSFERFLKAAQKALNSIEFKPQEVPEEVNSNDFVLVKGGSKGRLLKIQLEDVCYIEGLKNYVSIFTKTERIIAYLNIKDLAKDLPSHNFFRVHKSYIVAIDKISHIDGNEIKIEDGRMSNNTPSYASIPIGGTYKNQFFNFLKDKILGNPGK